MTIKSTIPAPIDYDVIRKVILGQIRQVTGLDQNHVIMEEPETEENIRPDRPYMSMKITTPAKRFGDDTLDVSLDNNGNPIDGQFVHGGPRRMTISFHAYGQSHEEAYEYMNLWQGALDLVAVQLALRQSGIAVWTIGDVADLSQLLNTAYEGRAQMDVTFGLASNIVENVGNIEEVQATGTAQTDAGNVGPIGIDVVDD